MKQLRAVIFDVDGTLVDSNDVHARAWQDAFGEFDREISFDDIRRQIGKGGDQLIPVFMDREERKTKEQALEKRRGEILKERYLQSIQPFPNVRMLFEAIVKLGAKIELASSAKSDDLEFYKQLANISDLVAEQTSSNDAEKSKPHPDIFEAALARLGFKNGDGVIVIGDTPYDADAAGRSGLRTIGVTCGGWSRVELERSGCVAVYKDPAELLSRVAEWTRLIE